MKAKNKPPVIPDNCCAACFHARAEKSSLFCFAQPPIHTEENGSYKYVRGIPVLPDDPPCYFFKPKEHA